MNDKSKLNALTARQRLPKGVEAESILARRAEELLSGSTPDEETNNSRIFLRCRTGADEWFGLPYHYLDEILSTNGLCNVPGTPEHIVGVINIHGELPVVIDVNPLFSLPPQKVIESSRIVVIRAAGTHAGLLVEDVEDEEVYQEEQVEQAFTSSSVTNMAHVIGLYDGRVTLLDLQALLTDPVIRVND
ncbi:MAG: chemotaxis protein CheW [Sedimenticola sp.]